MRRGAGLDVRWAMVAALFGVAGCGGEPAREAEPVEEAVARAARDDLPAPTVEDFLAVNTAPPGAWVSGPSSFDLPRGAEAVFAPSSASGAADRSGWARETILCMRRFAGQAYDSAGAFIHEDCGLKPTPWNSTDVMKVWDSIVAPAGGSQAVVIAFAGTRADAGDVLRDLQSQLPTGHVNPLDPALQPMPEVGSGWAARWHNQAQKLKGALDWYVADARAMRKTLQVYLVGHSLGGVTATLAGYDVAQYLRSRADGASEGYRVHVYAFNPPRLGGLAARGPYQDALFASMGTCPAGPGQTCLLMRQFTRTFDAVQSLPLGMHHPVWSTPAPSPRCADVVGPGAYDGRSLGYCAQINAPALSWWPGDNHQLAAWDAQIMALGDAELADGMFRVN